MCSFKIKISENSTQIMGEAKKRNPSINQLGIQAEMKMKRENKRKLVNCFVRLFKLL